MTAPLRALIVDDEAPAREGLRLRLRREENVLVLGEYGDPAAALEAVRLDAPDVVFVDIRMPGLDGFAFVERAQALGVAAFVFVTAYDEHAVRAFGVRALDYLLKPVEQERLHEAVVRARELMGRLRDEELAGRMRRLLADAGAARTPAPSPTGRIAVRTDGGIRFVASDDVDWVDAAGDAVRLHAGGETHVVRKSMGEMLAMLDARRFCRIHRSTIVNVDRIRELQPWFHGEYVVVLHDGTTLKLSRGHRDAVARLLGLDTG